MSVVPHNGRKRHLRITVEFGGQPYRKPDEGFFAISGNIGGETRWVRTGQCQRFIREICAPKWYKFMDELLALDKKYWLKYCKSIPKKDAERIKEIINS